MRLLNCETALQGEGRGCGTCWCVTADMRLPAPSSLWLEGSEVLRCSGSDISIAWAVQGCNTLGYNNPKMHVQRHGDCLVPGARVQE